MRRLSGVLAAIVMLTAGFGFVSAANGEAIKVKMDGDKKKDPVLAGRQSDGSIRVAAVLSARKDRVTSLDLPGGGATEPFIQAHGDVNRGAGAELFVRAGRNSVVDTISVLTIARGNLTLARSFFIDSKLGDGLAVGIRCGTVQGDPGIRAYLFKLGNKGRWNRTVTPYAWDKGRLVRRGKKTTGKVPLPSPVETELGCPKPTPPPEPPEKPPVLGSAGNRFFEGLGRVEPRSFSARQGTGTYFGFSWRGWGDARASARGSFRTGPGAARQSMSLSAFDLGQCQGRKTYRKLTLKASGGRAITLGVC